MDPRRATEIPISIRRAKPLAITTTMDSHHENLHPPSSAITGGPGDGIAELHDAMVIDKFHPGNSQNGANPWDPTAVAQPPAKINLPQLPRRTLTGKPRLPQLPRTARGLQPYRICC
ncbi:hypothetical protein EJ06DRAFT_262793 [Trichodelitschia bisporula]|uniref:Uncharacterized protein n=1 Tax=Trichodelitschia bisporula TaxID=703511 RepID=A0A6G1HIT8_9PEZI|nr:hypothetical protein EJ06DRAFT_262793 [Trichodelitschia bisporula]